MESQTEKFISSMLKYYRLYLKKEFCLVMGQKHIKKIPLVLVKSLLTFVDSRGIDYDVFWSVSFMGYAKHKGCDCTEVFDSFSGHQLRLYVIDEWATYKKFKKEKTK